MRTTFILLVLVLQVYTLYAQTCEKLITKADSLMNLQNKNLQDILTAINHYEVALGNCEDQKVLKDIFVKKENAEMQKDQIIAKFQKDKDINKAVMEFRESNKSSPADKTVSVSKRYKNLFFPDSYYPLKNNTSEDRLFNEIKMIISKSPKGNNTTDSPEDIFVRNIETRLYNNNYRMEDQWLFDSTQKEISKNNPISEELLYIHLRASLHHGWNLLIEKKWEPEKNDIAFSNIQETINFISGCRYNSPKINYALAGFENLISKYYQDINDSKNSHKHTLLALDHIKKAAAERPTNGEYMRSLFTYIRNLRYSPDSLLSNEWKKKFLSLSCTVAEFMKSNVANKFLTYSCILECYTAQIDEYLNIGDNTNQNLAITAIQQGIKDITSSEANSRRYYSPIFSALLYNRLSAIYNHYKKDSVNYKKTLQRAEENFLVALNGQLSSQSILNKFEDVFSDLVAFTNEAYSIEERINLYSNVIKRLEYSDNDFLNIKTLTIIYSNAYTNLGNQLLLRKTHTDTLAALANFSKAIEAFQKLEFQKYYSGYSEDYNQYCSMYSSAVKSYVTQGNYTMARKYYTDMTNIFLPLYKEYSFDFYLSQSLLTAAISYGDFLFKKERYKEAIPVLNFSSFEGNKQSTDYLARIYTSVDLGNKDLADTFINRSSYQSSGMKRFAISAKCGGLDQDFYVYVLDRAKGYPYKGIEDQAIWAKEARGCVIAEDVVTAFSKLQTIAWGKNVSFIDLCVYALNESKKESLIEEARIKEKQGKELTSEEEFALRKKNIYKLIEGKKPAIISTYLKWYLTDDDLVRADSLLDIMLKRKDMNTTDIRFYLKLIYTINTDDLVSKRLLLYDSINPRQMFYYAYLVGDTLISTDNQKWANYLNMAAIDSVYNIHQLNDTLKSIIAGVYNSLAWYSLLTKRFQATEYWLKKSLALDPTSLYPLTNMPHAYLFTNQVEKAKAEYSRLKDKPFQNDSRYKTFKDAFLDDLDNFEKAGITNDHFKEIKQLLNQQ